MRMRPLYCHNSEPPLYRGTRVVVNVRYRCLQVPRTTYHVYNARLSVFIKSECFLFLLFLFCASVWDPTYRTKSLGMCTKHMRPTTCCNTLTRMIGGTFCSRCGRQLERLLEQQGHHGVPIRGVEEVNTPPLRNWPMGRAICCYQAPAGTRLSKLALTESCFTGPISYLI